RLKVFAFDQHAQHVRVHWTQRSELAQLRKYLHDRKRHPKGGALGPLWTFRIGHATSMSSQCQQQLTQTQRLRTSDLKDTRWHRLSDDCGRTEPSNVLHLHWPKTVLSRSDKRND